MNGTTDGDIVSVYAIFASSDEAEEIGRAMIEERLAACVNILGHCTSIYRWNGTVGQAEEVPALFKTTMGQASKLIDAIAARHSYDAPAAVVLPIANVLQPYADWVRENCER